MQSTIELLDKALSVKRAAHWCAELNIDPSSLAKARERGRLSPSLAGTLAIELGADPMQWIAIAAIETERDNVLLPRLKATADSWRKRWDKNNKLKPGLSRFFILGLSVPAL